MLTPLGRFTVRRRRLVLSFTMLFMVVAVVTSAPEVFAFPRFVAVHAPPRLSPGDEGGVAEFGRTSTRTGRETEDVSWVAVTLS